MLDFTCSESVKKYGKEELLKFYKNDFVNMSNSSLKNMEKLDNDTYVMYYLNSEFATKKAFEIKVKVENDSTKLFFENKYPF
jgi:N-methylhydantoinase B/oxoprolinase/acetone carboxylase alpha subunit